MDLRDAEISEPLVKKARCEEKEGFERRNKKRAGDKQEDGQPWRKKAREVGTLENKSESEPVRKKIRTSEREACETCLPSEIGRDQQMKNKIRADFSSPSDTSTTEKNEATSQDGYSM